MAIEDFMKIPIPNPFEGLPQAIQAGFDIAAKRAAVQQQQQQIELEKQKVQMNFQEKAIELIPKIKGMAPKERNFFIDALAGFSKNGGNELPEDLIQNLKSSESTVLNLQDLFKTANEAYPLPEQLPFRVALITDALVRAGRSPTEASEIFKAESARALADSRLKQINAAEEKERRKRISALQAKTAPSPDFLTKASVLSPESQETVYNTLADIKSRAKTAGLVIMDPNKNKGMSKEQLDASRLVLKNVLKAAEDPNTLLSTAPAMMTDLELSLVGMGATAAGELQKKQASEATTKANRERLDIINKESKALRDNAKEQLKAINTASRVLNIINDPKIAYSGVGWQAVGTLLARYYDPETGVREGELDRILKSLTGSKIDQVKAGIEAVFKERTLKPAQRAMIGKLINAELAAIKEDMAGIRSGLDKKLSGTGLTADDIMSQVFFRKIPEFKELPGERMAAGLSGENPLREKGWLEKFSKRLGIGGEEAPAPAPTPSKSPTTAPQPPKSEAKAPSPGAGKSGLGKLFGVAAQKPEQTKQPEKPSPKASPLPKKGKWIKVPMANGLEVEEFVEQ